MDDIEITVFDEIKDYKEKIYFFNIRQWIFAIIIVAIVVPTYLILKDKIGEEVTSYIIIAIAGILGFIGFVKIHELSAEHIIPLWFRHYFIFVKPVHYITDKEYKLQHQKKSKKHISTKNDKKQHSRSEMKEIRKMQKEEKMLVKARKKYKSKFENIEEKGESEENNNELINKLSKLPKEQQDALLKLLER